MITERQLKTIHVQLGMRGLKEEKKSIVMEFTSGRTDSSSRMTKAEAAALIGHLKSLDDTEKSSTKMRNKVLGMCHEMGWRSDSGRIDMDRVNGWCETRGYLKKKLDAYSYSELPKLVTQVENMYKGFLNSM